MEGLRQLQESVTLHLKEAHFKKTRHYNKSLRDFLYDVG